MVIFTTWLKFILLNFNFCNRRVAGLAKFLSSKSFQVYSVIMKRTSLLWLSANPPVNMADMTSQREQRTSLWLWTRVPSTLNVTSEKSGCGRSVKNSLSAACLQVSFIKVSTCRIGTLELWTSHDKLHNIFEVVKTCYAVLFCTQFFFYLMKF